ncbi:MAG: hypothetical protein AB7O65_01455 [Candidatus Korobacteraceae bacterium]
MTSQRAYVLVLLVGVSGVCIAQEAESAPDTIRLGVPAPAAAPAAPEKPHPVPDVSNRGQMNKQTRMEVIRSLNAESVFIRRVFPMGPTGLMLKNGEIHPSEFEISQMIASYGPAVKPGDRARITNVVFKGDNRLIFELNGGPTKKKKWYERIEVGTGGNMTPLDTDDPSANARGSFVVLEFDKHVPEMTADEIKQFLYPVFDFHAKSAVEAYLDTLPESVKKAIENHEVLVGMNRDMVSYAKGRPPRKLREIGADGNPYEEWIYGQPPQDVEFVRFVGDEVVQLLIMSVDGKRTLNTEKVIELEKPELASQRKPDPVTDTGEKPEQPKRPSLRREGEAPTDPLPDMRIPDSNPRDPGEWGVPGAPDPNAPQPQQP